MIEKHEMQAFVARVQELIDSHYGPKYTLLDMRIPTIEIIFGRKYAKLVKNNGEQRFAYCFVNMTNGDILKAASWKAPAKHARGNINDGSNGMDAVTVHGARYL